MTFPICTSLQACLAPQDNSFGPNKEAHQLTPTEDAAVTSPATDAAGIDPVDDIDDRRLKRKISNRESARRSRARKQRHLDDLRALAARLRSSHRELTAHAHAARSRVAVVCLANTELRAEAAALNRRLEVAARGALALNQLYAAAAGLGTFEQAVASLMA